MEEDDLVLDDIEDEELPEGAVRVEEDEDEDEGEDEGDVESRQSRLEKKQNRFRAAQEERDREKARADAAEERARRAEFESEQLKNQRMEQQGTRRSPEDEELETVSRERTRLSAYYDALPETEKARVYAEVAKQSEELENKRIELVTLRAQRRNQPSPEVYQQQRNNQIMASRHPDVWTNNAAVEWARARYKQRRLEGRPDGMDLVDEVHNEARRAFRMKPAGNPSDGLKGRLTGAPSSSAGRAGRGAVLTRQDREIADDAFGHLPEKERYKHYYKTVVRKREKSVA
jgi:hypothetical protein